MIEEQLLNSNCVVIEEQWLNLKSDLKSQAGATAAVRPPTAPPGPGGSHLARLIILAVTNIVAILKLAIKITTMAGLQGSLTLWLAGLGLKSLLDRIRLTSRIVALTVPSAYPSSTWHHPSA